MTDEPEHAPNTNDDGNTAGNSPLPSPRGPVKGNENGSGGNGQGGGEYIAQNQNEPLHWTRYVEAICAIILVLITGTYTYYAGHQLGVMRDSLTQVKQSGAQSADQIERAIGNINWMGRSMDWSQKSTQEAMAGQVGAAQKANRIASEAMEAQTRPWIGIVGIPTVPDPGPPIWVYDGTLTNLKVRDYGPSPALDVIAKFIDVGWDRLPLNGDMKKMLMQSEVCDMADKAMDVALATNPTALTTVFPGPDGSSLPNSPFGHPRAHDVRLAVVGCISYKDSYGQRHHTGLAYGIKLSYKLVTDTSTKIPEKKEAVYGTLTNALTTAE